jgi:hypothetical protein
VFVKSSPRFLVRRQFGARSLVHIRRILAARPWIHWLLVAASGATVVWSVADHGRSVERARNEWGATREVWVAGSDLAPGDTIEVEARAMPVAMVPDAVVIFVGDDSVEGVARQHVAEGEMLTLSDLAAADGPGALVPAGWVAVPVVETPSSGASVGDRVQVASDGFVLSTDALVVGHFDQSTLVAVSGQEAAAVAAADDAGALTLLLTP